MASAKNEIKILFKAEAAEFNKEIKGLKDETTKLNKEFALEQEQLKKTGTEAQKLESRMDYLSKKQEIAGKAVKATEDQLQKAKATYGENSKEVEILENKLLDAKLAYEKVGTQIDATSDKLNDQTDKWKKAQKGLDDFGSKADNAGKKLAPVSAAAAGALTALVGVAVKSGEAADEINTLSKTSGLSVETLQKFSMASDVIDVSMEALTGALSKTTKSMSAARDSASGMTMSLADQEKQAISIEKAQIKYNDAVKKNGEDSLEAREANLKLKDLQDQTPAALKGSAEAFKTLGVSVVDSSGNLRDNEDVFFDSIEALGLIENQTERDAIAMQIFGKSATDLNPLILGGADALREMGQAAEDKGLILTQEELDTANALNDTLDTMKAETMQGLMKLGAELAPILVPLFQTVGDAISGVVDWLGGLDEKSLTMIMTILAIVAGLAPLLIIVGKVATGISALMGLFSAIAPIIAFIASPVGIIIAIVAALIAVGILLYKNWDTVKAKASELWSSISTTFENIKTAITDKIEDAKEAVRKAIEKIKGFFDFKWSLPSLKMPTFSLKGKFSLKPPSIPTIGVKWNADGGIFTKPTILNSSQGLQGVGEAGPEAILPLSKLAGLMREMMPDAYASTSSGRVVHEVGGNLNLNLSGANAGALNTQAIADQVLDLVLDNISKGNRSIPNRMSMLPFSY